MPSNAPQQRGQPNAGAGPHSAHPSSNPLVNYELSGTVRWLDSAASRIVVAVAATDGHAGGLLGHDVTVDLDAARLGTGGIDALVPGTDVLVKARLPRTPDAGAFDPLPASSVAIT